MNRGSTNGLHVTASSLVPLLFVEHRWLTGPDHIEITVAMRLTGLGICIWANRA